MRINQTKYRGFTLLELIISIAIVAVISSISISTYSGYVEATKTSQAINQVRALALLIDDYALDNGEYPMSLRDIGNENLKDPWGNPYVYFNLKNDENGNNGNLNSTEDSTSQYGSGGETNSSSDNHRESEEHSERDDHGQSDEHSENDTHRESNEHEEQNDRINIGAARKDGNLVPINTNYDLCSFGKDGKSKPPLRAKDSLDDIIYANDGSYIGLAKEF